MLLRVARSPLAGRCLGWVLAHMSFLIPVDRLRETETLIAFTHPRPSYPFHVLLIPKRARDSFAALSAADADFMLDLIQTVQSLVEEFGFVPLMPASMSIMWIFSRGQPWRIRCSTISTVCSVVEMLPICPSEDWR